MAGMMQLLAQRGSGACAASSSSNAQRQRQQRRAGGLGAAQPIMRRHHHSHQHQHHQHQQQRARTVVVARASGNDGADGGGSDAASTSAATATTTSSSSGSSSGGAGVPLGGDGRPVRSKDLGAGLKATWVAAELLGDAASALRGGGGGGGGGGGAAAAGSTAAAATAATAATTTTTTTTSAGATTTTSINSSSIDAVVAAIKQDYAVDYFISGRGDMRAYDAECLFADDFASFKGTERFKKNVANLGALLSDVDLQISGFDVRADASPPTVEVGWRFKGVLGGLPWRPLLAAAGSTTHVIDPARGVVVEHLERWKSDPGEVVKRLLRPAAKVPTNKWETFMLALSDGDAKGMWWAVSAQAAVLAAVPVAAAVAAHVTTGHGLPFGGGALEAAAGGLLAAALATEVVKFATAMYGGEGGSGGRF